MLTKQLGIMKKKYVCFGVGFIAAVCFLVISLSYDTDNIRITRDIYFDSQRKDILDREGKYEIPPKVLDYCMEKDIILVKWKPDYPIPATYEKYDYGYSDNIVILYWAIDLNSRSQIGPMDYTEFENYCTSNDLEIPYDSVP